MSSWFTGEGLSNQFTSFKDQISTFTKDVLTETTDEIDDPVGELRLAKQRIFELEKFEALQKEEQEKAQKHKDELSERAETAEFQIATLSQEYRKLFQEKDEQVQIVKEENVSLKEQLRILLSSQEDKVSTPVTQPMPDGSGNWMDSISDIVSSQSEINKLSAQLTKVKAECQHWKELANQHKVAGSDDLMVQLEELKHQLTHEQEQHQRELSALQHVHDENIQSLIRRHQMELQSSSLPDDSTDLADDLTAKVKELEIALDESTQQLEDETQSLRNSLTEKETAFEEQQEQLKEDSRSLAASLATCQERVIGYQTRIDQLQNELANALSTAESLQAQLTQEKQAREHVCEEVDELRKRLAAEKDDQVSKLSQEREQLSVELNNLQQRISEQITTISELETARKKVDSEMGQITQLLSAREAEIAKLQGQQHEDISTIQQQLAKVTKENTELKEQLKTKQENFQQQESQVTDSSSQVKLLELKQQVQDLEKQLAGKASDLLEKEQAIVVLREQTTQLTRAKCTQCDSSQDTIKELQVQLDSSKACLAQAEEKKQELCNEVKSMQQQQVTSVENVTSEKNLLQSEIAKQSKELDRLKTHLLQVEQEHSEEIVSFQEREIDFKQKLVQANEQLSLANTHKVTLNQESQEKVDNLTEQLYSIAQQRDTISLQLNTVLEEKDQLQNQVTNLQIVLEEFQKDHSSKLTSSEEMFHKELAVLTEQRDKLQEQLQDTKVKLTQALSSAESLEELRSELDSKNTFIKDMKQQMENLQKHLMSREQKFSLLNEQEECKVDKALVKNLILGYLSAPSRKKAEVMKLIASILEFSPSEIQQVSDGQATSGWMSGWWNKATPISPVNEESSFSKLFIKFLEMESNKEVLPSIPSSNYVDPSRDPDRPSLATAAMVTAIPSPQVPHRTPSLPTFEVPTTATINTSNSNSTLQTNSTGPSQNLILKELLTSTHVQ